MFGAGDARRWPLDWYRKHFPRTAEPRNEELTTATRAGKEVTGIALALAASYLRWQTTKRGRQSHAEVGCECGIRLPAGSTRRLARAVSTPRLAVQFRLLGRRAFLHESAGSKRRQRTKHTVLTRVAAASAPTNRLNMHIMGTVRWAWGVPRAIGLNPGRARRNAELLAEALV